MNHYPMRTALTDLQDPIYDRWIGDNFNRIAAFNDRMVETPTSDLVMALHHDGITQFPAANLVGKATLSQAHEELVAQVCTPDMQRRVEENKKRPWKDFVTMVRFGEEAWMTHSAVRLACDPRLLEEIGSYLGMWPRLCDVAVHVNYPTDTEASASQLWHRDPGDLRVVKVFLYLCDVTMENGPFCYVKGTHAFGRNAHIAPTQSPFAKIDQGERDIRWSDAEMFVAMPKDEYKICTGPLHTMIVADTVGFHRGLKPVSGGRILVCFTYCTNIAGRMFKLKQPPAWAKKESQIWALMR